MDVHSHQLPKPKCKISMDGEDDLMCSFLVCWEVTNVAEKKTFYKFTSVGTTKKEGGS